MTRLRGVLEALHMTPEELLTEVNNIAHMKKERQAEKRHIHRKDQEEYISTVRNRSGRGKGKYDTYGMSRATLYRVLSGGIVSIAKAELILEVIDNRGYQKLYKREPTYEGVGINVRDRSLSNGK